jgi:hypothetical protein
MCLFLFCILNCLPRTVLPSPAPVVLCSSEREFFLSHYRSLTSSLLDLRWAHKQRARTMALCALQCLVHAYLHKNASRRETTVHYLQQVCVCVRVLVVFAFASVMAEAKKEKRKGSIISLGRRRRAMWTMDVKSYFRSLIVSL